MGPPHESDPEPQPRSPPHIGLHAGRYLVASYWLWAKHERRIRTGEVSERLDVEPASVTEMFEKLAHASVVKYEKRHGVKLTETGKRLARRLAWRQCLVRTFFAAVVDTELSGEAAFRIGYVLPDDGIAGLQMLVDHPCDTACRETTTAGEYCLLSA